MSKEEPAWRAELEKGLNDALGWRAEYVIGFVVKQIGAAEQRGFQAGVNKTGDSVGKLRAKLARVRKLADDWAMLRTHGGAAYELRAVLDDPDKP